MQKIQTKIFFKNKNSNLKMYNFKNYTQSFPIHFHNYYTIGLIKQGKRILFCNNKKYLIKKGDILLFAPETPHGCDGIDSSGFEYTGLNIPKEDMKSLIYEISNQNSLIDFSFNVINYSNYLNYQSKLENNFNNIYEIFSNENLNENFLKEEILSFIEKLLMNKTAILKEKNEKNFDKIYLSLEKNNDNKTNLRDLTKHLNLSKSSLRRLFIQQKSITPYKYIKNTKLIKAENLLKSNLSLAQIALLTGFCNQSHFSNSFKNYFGFTPYQYRKKFKSTQ